MCFLKRYTDISEKKTLEGFSGVIDMHSHFLPFADDGSRSVEESLNMLKLSYSQGVRRIVATPHFYPESESPDEFILKREKSVMALRDALEKKREIGETFPEVYVGAEVAFFNGMSRCADLDKLCVIGTKLLLLEMPFEKWTETVIEELIAIKNARGLTPVIAHIERYAFVQKKRIIEQIFSEGILIQANAEAFISGIMKNVIMRMLADGKIDVIGSDCHDILHRPPNMDKAIVKIQDRLGSKRVEELTELGNSLLKNAQRIM